MMFRDLDAGVFDAVQEFDLKVIDTQFSLASKVEILNVLEITLYHHLVFKVFNDSLREFGSSAIFEKVLKA